MATAFAPISETTAEEYRRVTETTYLGYVHGTQAGSGPEGRLVAVGFRHRRGQAYGCREEEHSADDVYGANLRRQGG